MRLLELLNIETGAPIETIKRVISTAPRRYKVYEIPKRTQGTRVIAHPARELKLLQRVFLHEVLDKIEASEIAMAYVENRGILKNALIHAEQRWILKLDFRNFFGSIGPADWDRAVQRTEALFELKKDRKSLHNLLFWGAGQREPRSLSIGAPTSPSVSNLVCAKLDAWLIRFASDSGLRVSRYADDITISGPNIPQLVRFETRLKALLSASRGLRLELNEEKRGLYGPGERRMVTGLIITPDGKVSLGRERKREIHALIHKFTIGCASVEQIMRGKGLLGFAKMAEREFYESIINKYGEDKIAELQRYELPEVLDL